MATLKELIETHRPDGLKSDDPLVVVNDLWDETTTFTCAFTNNDIAYGYLNNNDSYSVNLNDARVEDVSFELYVPPKKIEPEISYTVIVERTSKLPGQEPITISKKVMSLVVSHEYYPLGLRVMDARHEFEDSVVDVGMCITKRSL